MKTIASILLFAFAITLRAATPVVVVKSAGQVTIDGQSAGTVVDALANNAGVPNIRGLLLDAWLAYETAIIAKADAAAKFVSDRAQADAAKAVTDALARTTKAESDSAKATALVAMMTPENLPALPLPVRAALAEIQKSDAEKELAALQVRTAALQAKLKAP